jgi:hypothetical protein
MSNTFDEWLNETEGFSLRMERIYDDLVKNPKDIVDNWQQIKEWLQASYDEGFDNGYSVGYDDGCEIGSEIQ